MIYNQYMNTGGLHPTSSCREWMVLWALSSSLSFSLVLLWESCCSFFHFSLCSSSWACRSRTSSREDADKRSIWNKEKWDELARNTHRLFYMVVRAHLFVEFVQRSLLLSALVIQLCVLLAQGVSVPLSLLQVTSQLVPLQTQLGVLTSGLLQLLL